MSEYDSELDTIELLSDDNIVTVLKARAKTCRQPPPYEQASVDMHRYPVDIRGQVTFGRLMSGLATVGLSVRIDSRSGRVIITDENWE